MIYKYEKLMGTTGLRLGMRKAEVSSLLGNDYLSPPIALQPDVTRFVFQGLGLSLYFSAEDKVELMGFRSPAELVFGDLSLLSDTMRSVVNTLQKIDPAVEFNYNGLVSRELGISLYSSDFARDGLTPFEDASIFRKGYYDEVMSF